MGHPAFAAGMGSGCESSRRDYLEFPMYRQQMVGAPFKPLFGLSGIRGTRPREAKHLRDSGADALALRETADSGLGPGGVYALTVPIVRLSVTWADAGFC